MKTYVFPGQGSQAKGMGGTLFDEFAELTAKADELLGYSIKTLCLDDPNDELGKTQFTQPAIYVVNALSYYKKLADTGQKPNFVAGHSLGEYNALLAAEVFDFETGLALVKKRGLLMSQASGGAMAAILGLHAEGVAKIIEENHLHGIDIANYNALSQIVISGLKDEINQAEPFFRQDGVHFIPLNTSGAFHSRYMRSARDEFKSFLAKFNYSDLTIPVISNVHARPYQQTQIVSNLGNQITSSVQWSESIRYLMGQGVMQFEQLGHGSILTNLIEKIQQEMTPLVLDKSAAITSYQNESKQKQSELVFMYSGQGSHYYQMGRELYQKNHIFRQTMNQCSAMLEPYLNKSLVDVIYDDSKKYAVFDDILYTHPAIFCVEYSLTQVLRERGIHPKSVLGYSLGEYIAAVVAGVISLEDGLKLVVQQAKYLTKRCDQGAMLVVLDQVTDYHKNQELFEACTLAGINYASNYIVSGLMTRLQEVNVQLKRKAITSQLLAVNYAFHSALIDPIKNDFEGLVDEVKFQSPKIPIYSCVNAAQIHAPDAQHFWSVVRKKIQFEKLIPQIMHQVEPLFVDLSPTGTLANFIKYGFGKTLPSFYAINQFGQDLKTIDKLVVDVDKYSLSTRHSPDVLLCR